MEIGHLRARPRWRAPCLAKRLTRWDTSALHNDAEFAVLLPGVVVGAGALGSAGSVVTRDVTQGTTGGPTVVPPV